MFKHNQAFSSFSVNDIPKAKTFYTEILGVAVAERGGLLELQMQNGGKIIVYPKPHHTPATFTVLNFAVDNIEQAIVDLTAQSVVFEHYEGEVSTDEHGIFKTDGLKQAWFKDPAGNILSVIETH